MSLGTVFRLPADLQRRAFEWLDARDNGRLAAVSTVGRRSAKENWRALATRRFPSLELLTVVPETSWSHLYRRHDGFVRGPRPRWPTSTNFPFTFLFEIYYGGDPKVVPPDLVRMATVSHYIHQDDWRTRQDLARPLTATDFSEGASGTIIVSSNRLSESLESFTHIRILAFNSSRDTIQGATPCAVLYDGSREANIQEVGPHRALRFENSSLLVEETRVRTSLVIVEGIIPPQTERATMANLYFRIDDVGGVASPREIAFLLDNRLDYA